MLDGVMAYARKTGQYIYIYTKVEKAEIEKHFFNNFIKNEAKNKNKELKTNRYGKSGNT
jgi:prophage antirepressor-like protein